MLGLPQKYSTEEAIRDGSARLLQTALPLVDDWLLVEALKAIISRVATGEYGPRLALSMIYSSYKHATRDTISAVTYQKLNFAKFGNGKGVDKGKGDGDGKGVSREVRAALSKSVKRAAEARASA